MRYNAYASIRAARADLAPRDVAVAITIEADRGVEVAQGDLLQRHAPAAPSRCNVR